MAPFLQLAQTAFNGLKSLEIEGLLLSDHSLELVELIQLEDDLREEKANLGSEGLIEKLGYLSLDVLELHSVTSSFPFIVFQLHSVSLKERSQGQHFLHPLPLADKHGHMTP